MFRIIYSVLDDIMYEGSLSTKIQLKLLLFRVLLVSHLVFVHKKLVESVKLVNIVQFD